MKSQVSRARPVIGSIRPGAYTSPEAETLSGASLGHWGLNRGAERELFGIGERRCRARRALGETCKGPAACLSAACGDGFEPTLL